MQVKARSTVSEVARVCPGALEVFDSVDIDYCCRGASSLEDAADDAGIDVEELIAKLGALTEESEPALGAIVRELIDDHRRCISHDIPEVRDAIDQARAGNDEEPLVRVERLFSRFAATITAHMLTEERDLLPNVMQLQVAENGRGPAPMLRISHRVLGELVEHERLHEQLNTMRMLACETTASDATIDLRQKLTSFMHDVQRHMHLENNVLYPRAIDIENRLKRVVRA